MTPVDPSIDFPAEERGRFRSKSAAASILLHAAAITAIIVVSGNTYRPEKFRRPPTFSLVSLPAPPPESPAAPPPAREQVKQAAVPKPSPVASAQTDQPKAIEAAPDLTDKTPVPSTEPAPPAVASSASPAAPTGPKNGAGQGGDADQPVAVGSVSMLDNTNFSPIFNPKPAYPVIALKANIQGYVDVELVVTPAGIIESFSIVKAAGHPAFGDETAKVIKRWRFPPPRINGKPAKIKYEYRVNFTLD
jgi:periplasmic protein TonB